MPRPLGVIVFRLSRLKAFDYKDLSFQYVACMVLIALVYTAFRASEFYLDTAESKALVSVQKIDEQRDLATNLERIARFAQDEAAGPDSLTTNQLIDNYRRLYQIQSELVTDAATLKGPCANRACERLFREDSLPFAPEALAAALTDKSLPVEARAVLLREILDATALYRTAMRDTLTVALEMVRATNDTALTWDLVAYVALMGLLLLLGLYVFRPAIRRLNASLATRSDFLSRISHEIRNPMNSILGMADILKNTKLNFEQQQYVTNLIRSGNALLEMLNNLIDFSVIEGGRLQLKASPFDLFHSLDRCLDLISIQAHHKNLAVYLFVDPRIPNRLVGDPLRLDQVLINLLNNAVKFTEHGSVCLSVECLDETDHDVGLAFAVSDTGIGVRHEQLDEIFESFVQADSSIQRKYGGSGLGLSIARQIVRSMGGELSAESELGRGSRFQFSIRFDKRKSRRGQGERAKPLQQLTKLKFAILAADSEESAYRQAIRTMGFEGVLLHSAQALAEYLETTPPGPLDELLVDDSIGIIAMIKCRNVSDHFGLGGKTVALIRSNFTKENMDLLRRNGYTRFLIKPVKPWEFLHLPAPAQDAASGANVQASADTLAEQLRQRNLRVLLVDDSNDNLFLLKALIEPITDVIHVAENGLQALEKFRNNSYDAVFMDLQMPVMDGYTAVCKMRETERDTQHPTPIFAVTAHSGLVDGQKCFESGFTDRLVKPIARKDIFRALARHFTIVPAVREAEAMPASLPAELMARLLPTYYKTRLEDIGRLQAAVKTKDYRTVKNLGHKIRGGAANYGFSKTSELSQELENAAAREDIGACKKILSAIEQTLQAETSLFKA